MFESPFGHSWHFLAFLLRCQRRSGLQSKVQKPICMTKKFSLIVIVTVMSIVTLFAQKGTTKAAEGTLTLSKKTFQLKNAVAYESTTGREEEVAVVLSAQPGNSNSRTGGRRVKRMHLSTPAR